MQTNRYCPDQIVLITASPSLLPVALHQTVATNESGSAVPDSRKTHEEALERDESESEQHMISQLSDDRDSPFQHHHSSISTLT